MSYSTYQVILCVHLGAADPPDLVVVPAGGEGEEPDQEAQPGEELQRAADLEHVA